MVKLKGLVSMLFVAMFMATGLNAQEIFDPNLDRNENSVRPVRYADIMYKKTLWKRMDLRTKMNEPFYAQESQISRIIIDAVKEGLLRPYTNDSLLHRMTNEDFLKNLKLPDSGGGDEDDWGDDEEDGWDDEEEEETGPVIDEYFPHQFSLLEIREDLIFDKRRSKMYHDIQSITLILPGEENPATGLEKPIGTFSYKELVENVFKGNPKARHYNPNNEAEHRNLAHAFDLALHDATLIQYSNPRDALIEDIFNGNLKQSLGAGQVYEMNLVEYESHLWSN